MSISAPPGRPSISQTLGSSFRDAAALAKTNVIPAALLIVTGTIAAYMYASSAAVTGSQAGNILAPGVAGIAAVAEILVMVVSYYAMAAAVRTIHADYRMTFGQFWGILGYSLLFALLTCLAAVFFVIPAYWIGGKLLLMPFTYAITNGSPDTVKTTWNMTTGYYWQTVGMFLLEGLCVAVIGYVVFMACGFAAMQMPVSTIVLAPIAIAVFVWLIHVRMLVCARWTHGLLPRAGGLQEVTLPAPA